MKPIKNRSKNQKLILLNLITNLSPQLNYLLGSSNSILLFYKIECRGLTECKMH